MMVGFKVSVVISVHNNKQELMISSGGMYLNCSKCGLFSVVDRWAYATKPGR